MNRPALQSAENWSAAVSASSMTSSPRAAAASKKATSRLRARARPEAWKAAPSSGKRPASAMQTRNISCAPGEKRNVAKLAAIRRSATSTGSPASSPPITSPVRPHCGLHHRLEELPLVGEIAVERRLGGAGGAGDLVDAGAFVAAVHEDLPRAFQDLGALRAAPARFRSLTPVFLMAGAAGGSNMETVPFSSRQGNDQSKQVGRGDVAVPSRRARGSIGVVPVGFDRADLGGVSVPHWSPLMPAFSSSWVQTGALPAVA